SVGARLAGAPLATRTPTLRSARSRSHDSHNQMHAMWMSASNCAPSSPSVWRLRGARLTVGKTPRPRVLPARLSSQRSRHAHAVGDLARWPVRRHRRATRSRTADRLPTLVVVAVVG